MKNSRIGMGCLVKAHLVSKSSVKRLASADFGQLSSGESTQLFTLQNKSGTRVSITNFGGIITTINTEDKNGIFADIVLGYDNIQSYEHDPYYLGAIIGRYAGRIEQGTFSIADETFQLSLNAPNSQLHGGKKALNKQLWQAKTFQDDGSASVELTYTSPDGEEGFPGTVNFKIIYRLDDDNQFTLEYFAHTDKATLVNLTQHSYFNLAGHNSGNILTHQVYINADHFLPMTEHAYPTGEQKQVKGTAHDFTNKTDLRTLADEINGKDRQIKIALGYDNYWLLNEECLSGEVMAAKAVEKISGRCISIYSDQPSLILYTANYIDGSQIGKEDYCYQPHAALCLESQRANSLQQGCSLDNVLLTPEADFYSKTRWVFSCL
ncbi:aldose epimerase family protein [Colwellia hornerae]|uniref:Aldose 1-epimerase n=1 Tax=Colwellia hornerae TaxID=89402 RepID=A0A5C6Q8V7_9GAMM|nr:aldose epimerase family protein [Colwellia hornerae]TWX53078.1 galactose mutarotase [Colwellia hornerae]TWX59341.1 galactose mutarotase [Colwellia hornerae]TWX65465.1 galactose mutarotase [Colwellia hornerae]